MMIGFTLKYPNVLYNKLLNFFRIIGCENHVNSLSQRLETYLFQPLQFFGSTTTVSNGFITRFFFANTSLLNVSLMNGSKILMK